MPEAGEAGVVFDWQPLRLPWKPYVKLEELEVSPGGVKLAVPASWQAAPLGVDEAAIALVAPAVNRPAAAKAPADRA